MNKLQAPSRIQREAIRIVVAGLIICGAWFVAPTSCVQYVPSPTLSQSASDQIILRAEQSAETAKLTFNTFLHLERDNQALLQQVNPNIHVWAENIRTHGIDWIVSLRNATKTFKANRTPQNQANLNTILTTLTNAVLETNKYITQSKKAVLP